jgi:hypothetical protein
MAALAVESMTWSWQWIIVFGCGFVEVCEVDAHPPFAILLLDRYGVR